MTSWRKHHWFAKDCIYGVYKGDKYLFADDWWGVIERLQISESTMRYYLSDSYKKRFKHGDKNRLVIVNLGRIWETEGVV